MAKKILSFAEKAARSKKKQENKYVKYVKSVRSEKTGQWRFNETMVTLVGGESLDSALKRMEQEVHARDIEMPVVDHIEQVEQIEKSVESDELEKTEEETVTQEKAPVESVAEESKE